MSSGEKLLLQSAGIGILENPILCVNIFPEANSSSCSLSMHAGAASRRSGVA